MKNLLAISLVFILLFGCLGFFEQKPKVINENVTKIVQVEKKPTIYILSPLDGQVVKTIDENNSVEIRLSTQNLILEKIHTKNISGEGHFQVTIDNSSNTTAYYLKTFTINNLVEGQHTVKIEVVNNDNTSYKPPISKTVSFIVQKLKTGPGLFEVVIENFTYTPGTLEIKKGDIVAWSNKGNIPQSVTSTGIFNSGIIENAGNYAYQFNESGNYSYFSTNYPSMRGQIIVKD